MASTTLSPPSPSTSPCARVHGERVVPPALAPESKGQRNRDVTETTAIPERSRSVSVLRGSSLGRSSSVRRGDGGRSRRQKNAATRGETCSYREEQASARRSRTPQRSLSVSEVERRAWLRDRGQLVKQLESTATRMAKNQERWIAERKQRQESLRESQRLASDMRKEWAIRERHLAKALDEAEKMKMNYSFALIDIQKEKLELLKHQKGKERVELSKADRDLMARRYYRQTRTFVSVWDALAEASDAWEGNKQVNATLKKIVQLGIRRGFSIDTSFLSSLHPDLPGEWRSLLEGYQSLIDGDTHKSSQIYAFYSNFWAKHGDGVETILRATLDSKPLHAS